MPSMKEIAFAVFGAYRLAMFDRAGIAYLDRSTEGALRSFAALAIVLPIALLIDLIYGWDYLAEGTAIGFLAVRAFSFLISLCAYLLIVERICRVIEHTDQYPGFVTAYNWSSALQALLMLIAVSLAHSGLFPPTISETLVSIVAVMVLTYSWFVARTALNLSAPGAAALVILDMVITLVVGQIVHVL